MKVLFTKHSDTSLGRVKIGTIVDLPTKEAKDFIQNNKASVVEKVVEPIVEEFQKIEVQSNEQKDE